MNKKTTNVIMWILSIFFILGAISGLLANQAGSWLGIFLLIPGLLLNPKLVEFLNERYHLKLKWWINLLAVLIPFIIIGVVTPQPSFTQTPQAASSYTSTASSSPEISSSSSPAFSSSSSASTSSTITETIAAAPTSGAKLKVHYIDVGQGDSEFLELPNKQTMLIDAGNPENGTQIINYIKSLGYNKIDILVATHPHSDHIGGMASVVNSLDIGKVYMPKVSTNTKTFEGLLSVIQAKGLKVNTAKAGISLVNAGNLNIDMIAPVGTSYEDLNQYSAVIKVTYGDNKFLFMGDAGNTSESQIGADVKADVLKVGHHGSNTATSEAFLQRVRPKYSVIEVGQGNSYGHPTAATLSKLQNVGAAVYRTDENGTIIFTSDSKTITVDKKASALKQQAPPASSASVAKSSSSQSSIKSPAIVAPSTDNQSVTVYITDTGKKYHTDGCRYLKKSKHAISLKNAQTEGYEPCSVCNPPQ